MAFLGAAQLFVSLDETKSGDRTRFSPYTDQMNASRQQNIPSVGVK